LAQDALARREQRSVQLIPPSPSVPSWCSCSCSLCPPSCLVAVSPAGMFVDANGNICKQAPSNPRRVELLPSSAGAGATGAAGRGGGSRFMTLEEGGRASAPSANDAQTTMLSIRQSMLGFKCKSVIGLLIGVQVLFYVISIWIVPPRQLYYPSPASTWRVGSPSQPMERCAVMVGSKFLIELRRIVVPIFLHTGLLHILFNVSFQVTFGPLVLEKYGVSRYAILFFGTGSCGVLLSGAMGHVGIGASTACMGLMGIYVAWVGLVWGQMLDPTWRWFHKLFIGGTVAFGIIWELIGLNTLDHFGHLGGLLSGAILGVILGHGELMPTGLPKWKRICSVVLFACVMFCVVRIFCTGPDHFLDKGDGTFFTWRERCEIEWQHYWD